MTAIVCLYYMVYCVCFSPQHSVSTRVSPTDRDRLGTMDAQSNVAVMMLTMTSTHAMAGWLMLRVILKT